MRRLHHGGTMVTSTTVPRLIALDWGTSSLRAYLLGEGGTVLAQRVKPWGIMRTSPRPFAKVFAAIAGGWRRRWPSLPALAAGMIGSAQGWCEAPYVPCPAGMQSLVAGLARATEGGRIQLHIVPGRGRRWRHSRCDARRRNADHRRHGTRLQPAPPGAPGVAGHAFKMGGAAQPTDRVVFHIHDGRTLRRVAGSFHPRAGRSRQPRRLPVGLLSREASRSCLKAARTEAFHACFRPGPWF